MRCKTYNYLPSRSASPLFGRYHVILLGDKDAARFVNNLRKVVSWKRNGWELNSQPSCRRSSALTTKLPGHTVPWEREGDWLWWLCSGRRRTSCWLIGRRQLTNYSHRQVNWLHQTPSASVTSQVHSLASSHTHTCATYWLNHANSRIILCRKGRRPARKKFTVLWEIWTFQQSRIDYIDC